jgi:hypothetical protein
MHYLAVLDITTVVAGPSVIFFFFFCFLLLYCVYLSVQQIHSTEHFWFVVTSLTFALLFPRVTGLYQPPVNQNSC